jgi:protoheme IX farnesyltransferase
MGDGFRMSHLRSLSFPEFSRFFSKIAFNKDDHKHRIKPRDRRLGKHVVAPDSNCEAKLTKKDVGVTTTTVDNPLRGVVFDLQFDTPPVLFIRKYGEVIDTKDIVFHDGVSELEKSITPQTLTQKKIKYIQDAVKHAKTFEKLSENLKKKPEPLLAPVTTGGKVKTPSVFQDSDFEVIKPNKAEVKIPRSLDGNKLEWKSSQIDFRQLPNFYLMLAKSRLTLLVCITASAGYGLAPGAFEPSAFILTTLGTAAFSAAANSVNQIMEVPFDSQMNRTKNRVLVRGNLSTLHAACFAAVMTGAGWGMLYSFVNPLAATLGLANLVLYTCVYTPMKRVSIVNTWIGSVVGAIPPLIGWAGCCGELDAGALILAGILFTWQFPHFNALSWNLRPDYSKAGYRMMSVTHPDLSRRVALRYSAATIAVCTAAPLLEVTSWAFAADSLPLNLYLTYLAWKFYQKADSNTSRKLFRFTLIHLPLLMTLMCISKTRKKSDVTEQKLEIQKVDL